MKKYHYENIVHKLCFKNTLGLGKTRKYLRVLTRRLASITEVPSPRQIIMTNSKSRYKYNVEIPATAFVAES